MNSNNNDPLFGEHRDPEEIREDIRETTAEITQKLEALQSKLQPDAIVAEATEEVKDRALDLVAKVRRHPAAVAILGVGAAVIVGRAIAGARSGGQSSSLVAFAIGAVVGAATYRVLAGDAYREDDEEVEPTATPDVSPPALPKLATLS